MSGILGILNLDGGAVSSRDLTSMASLLERRGPDRTALWHDGHVGLGHTRLTTTPQLAIEPQPIVHHASGCAITADARLDNRAALIASLHLSDRARAMGDAELILEAYLAWGNDCADRLLGDFAFAIWDPRRRGVFCARDPFGMRPFYYHHGPGRCFIFASEPRAILVLPHVPYRINEGRIADYLVPELEWIDYACTFFEDVYRLPAGHMMTATPAGAAIRRYWTPEPGPLLRLPTNEAYAEALLDVLTQAVTSRLRAAGRVGATLSGGLDSGAVVAVAQALVAAQNQEPLATFSGVGSDPGTCLETQAIHAALTMGRLEPHLVDYSRLDGLLPELEHLTRHPEEPFDSSMVLLSALYVTARRQGIRVVLDGAAGDVVLGEGTHVVRLFRQGRWARAWREASGRDRYYVGGAPVVEPLRSVRAALTPDVVRRAGRRVFAAQRAARLTRRSLISPEFAQRISLPARLRTMSETFGTTWTADHRRELASTIQPNIVAGRERYGRVAAAAGVEARDPFLDRRVVEFCLTLPGDQRLDSGWPKIVLRRAMAGRLPEAVLWRQGKPHLGWAFATALMKAGGAGIREEAQSCGEVLRPFVLQSALDLAWGEYFDKGDAACLDQVLTATTLGRWLQSSATRPVAIGGGSC